MKLFQIVKDEVYIYSPHPDFVHISNIKPGRGIIVVGAGTMDQYHTGYLQVNPNNPFLYTIQWPDGRQYGKYDTFENLFHWLSPLYTFYQF